MKNLYSVTVLSMIAILIAMTAGSAQAVLRDSGELCGSDALCKNLEGKELDLIKYYSLGSVLVVLYDSEKVGDLTLFVPEFDYTRGRGTVINALVFLESIPETNGFAVIKGMKSVGWFKTEVLEDIYVIKPQYEVTSEYLAPDYRFSDKGGKIIMHITPLYEPDNDYDD